jgi:hypothetical protein
MYSYVQKMLTKGFYIEPSKELVKNNSPPDKSGQVAG